MTIQIFVNIGSFTEILIFENDIMISIDEIIILAFKKHFNRNKLNLKDHIIVGKSNFIRSGIFTVNNNKYRYGSNLYFNVSLLNNCTLRHNYTSGKDILFNKLDVEKIISIIS